MNPIKILFPRIIQRLFLLCMAVWMSTFIYQKSLLEVILKAHQVHSGDLNTGLVQVTNGQK